MTAIANAFLRLHWDTSGMRREAEAGVRRSDLPALGREQGSRFGTTFGGAVGATAGPEAKKSTDTGMKRANLPATAREHGRRFGQAFGSTFGSTFGALSRSILGAAAVIGVGELTAAVVHGSETFQASMTRIQTQAGASRASVRLLTRQVLDLGGSVQQGPQQLADALYHLKSVGLDNVQAMKALRVASDLAAVGGADLEQTTNAIAGAWRSGIRGAHSFAGAASTVNAIIGAGNMRMSDFITAIGTGILPAARTFGLSLGQVGAALALMTDEGIPAVDAATRLRMSFSLLGAPSKQADAQLHSIGLNGLQLADAMRSPGGLIAALTLLKSHLEASGLSASRQAQVLSRAFGGGRSSSAILTLLNNLEVLRQKQEQVNRSTGKYGPAVEAQRKTAQAQFALLRSTVETFGIRVGNVVLPALNSIVRWVNTTGIPALGRFFALARNIGRQPTGLRDTAPATPGQVRGREPLQVPDLTAWQRFFRVLRDGAVTAGRILTSFLRPVLVDVDAALSNLGGSVKIFWQAWSPFIGPVLKAALGLLLLALQGLGVLLRFVIAPAIRALAVINRATLDIMRRGWIDAYRWLRGIWGTLPGIWRAVTSAISGAWTAMVTSVRQAWRAAMRVLRNAAADFVGAWLTIVGQILHGAAIAFGWVPGIGGKLRGASDAFDRFRTRVNNSLRGINNRQVGVRVNFATGQVHAFGGSTGGPGGKLARGGPVKGPGGPTDDTAGLFALSNNEYVIPARAHRKYGTRFLDAVRDGRIQQFQAGGATGVTVRPSFPAESAINAGITGPVTRLAVQWAKQQFLSGVLTPGLAGEIIRYALRFVGTPYRWGGTTPAGWDCSGFTSFVYHHFGIPAPRTSQAQQLWATPSGQRPGALVFFYGRNGAASHVGLALGGGRMVNAEDPARGTRVDSVGGNTGFGVPPGPGGIPAGLFGGGGGTSVELGRAMAAALYGWRGLQWQDLYQLWNRESGWRANARNPTSGAAGIPQDITGNFHGGARGQILWGLRYIRSRYGTPAAAWGHELSAGWYDNGGGLPPGLTLALNTTGRTEQVVPAGRGGDRPPVVINLGGVTIRERADVDLLSRRLAFGINAAGFG